MRIVFISDSHGYHKQLHVPEGDMLVHTGDVSGRGMESQVVDFLDWFAEQPHRHKIFIAGNHDFYFEQAPAEAVRAIIPAGVFYLQDSGIVVDGIRIWGSPASTWFYNWAFNIHPGTDMEKHWSAIPPDTDILLTHGPPLGIMDKIHSGINIGCGALRKKVWEFQPRVHAFGHIHEGYGMLEDRATTFINSSVLTASYKLANEPVVFNWR
jgi:predicted phosphohydrolase